MRRCWSAWACSAALVGAAGCGAARPAPPVVSADWRANARQVVQQLRVDIATAAVGGTTSAAAAKALRNTSDLVRAPRRLLRSRRLPPDGQLGRPPARVARAFAPACRHLERASALFARATQRSDPAALVRATREIGLAEPALVRAMLAIRDG